MSKKRLKEAAENAYNAWMGGTMNDVRDAMKELGEVIEKIEQKPTVIIPYDFEKYVEQLLSLSDGEGHGSPPKVKEVCAELLRLAKLQQKPSEWSEEGLTEFEKELNRIVIAFSDAHVYMDKNEIHHYSKGLLDLAREELQPEFDKEMDKMLAETDKVVYQKGHEDALKSLPKWKKVIRPEQKHLIYGFLSWDNYYLSIQELKDKLPKEE